MKVLHIVASMETGGAQKLIRHLLPELKKDGIDAELLVYHRTGSDIEKETESEIKVHCLDCKNIYNPLIAVRLVPYIRKFDIVHGHLFPVLYHLAVANLICRKMLVYTEHSTNNGRRGRKGLRSIERAVYRRYASVVSVSENVRDELSRWIGIKNGGPRMDVVWNGIPIETFREVSPDVSMEEFWGRTGVACLMVSRFDTSKDHATVIRAIPLIDNKDVFFAFAGDGKTLQDCIMLAKETGVSDRCLFLGNRTDIPRLIANSHIGIQSSNYEGFGLSAIEIIAGGKPLVATDVPGLSEIVKGYSLSFDKGDAKGLANHINRLLDDKSYYEQVAKRCCQRANDFDISCTASGYKKIYCKIINRN